jgi:tripartite-type tricarboxylate transporter receptor subunit TctC
VLGASCLVAAGCALTLAIGEAAAADTYPTHSIRWVVGYPPGGTTDLLARIIGQRLNERLGQQVVIDNRPGAANNIGTEIVVKAQPDGYTFLLVNPANAINATLYQSLPFDFLRDIVPVAGLVRVPNVMEVTMSLPVKTVPDFIAHAKANPGKVILASSGSGTSVHLSGENVQGHDRHQPAARALQRRGPALVDLIGGQVHVMFDNLPSSIEHIKGGKLRALAVTTQKRSPALPDVPTVADTVPGYEASAWFGMGAPKGTPAERHRKAQQGNQRRAHRSKDSRASRGARRRPDSRQPLRFRQAACRRNREMGESRQSVGRESRMSSGLRPTRTARPRAQADSTA